MNASSLVLGLVHWNPHYECFVDNPTCTAAATSALTDLLAAPGTDFANVVMFEVPNTTYSPPSGWAAIGAYQSCGYDWATLFYNTDKWSIVASDVGCDYDPSISGRSYSAATFSSKEDSAMTLTMMGAHFPQTLNASTHAYEDATAVLKGIFAKLAPSGGNMVLMADTNTESPQAAAVKPDHHGVNKTNQALATDLGMWHSQADPPAAPLYYGCCFSDGFQWQGDRVVANFGSVTSSEVLFDPAPSWAAGPKSEFHKGMRAMLEYSPRRRAE